jgi:hypothetical protein
LWSGDAFTSKGNSQHQRNHVYRFENKTFSAIGLYINLSKKNNLSISLFFSRFLNQEKRGFFICQDFQLKKINLDLGFGVHVHFLIVSLTL